MRERIARALPPVRLPHTRHAGVEEAS